jgi:hypothetical protein
MHSMGLAASPAGVTPGGWMALALGYAAALAIAWVFTGVRALAGKGA